jgi:hypothetical protein
VVSASNATSDGELPGPLFATRLGYDLLILDNDVYHGDLGPARVAGVQTVLWTANSPNTSGDAGSLGWRICAAAGATCSSLPPDQDGASFDCPSLPAASGATCQVTCDDATPTGATMECVDGSWTEDRVCHAKCTSLPSSAVTDCSVQDVTNQADGCLPPVSADCTVPAESGSTCEVACPSRGAGDTPQFVPVGKFVCRDGTWTSRGATCARPCEGTPYLEQWAKAAVNFCATQDSCQALEREIGSVVCPSQGVPHGGTCQVVCPSGYVSVDPVCRDGDFDEKRWCTPRYGKPGVPGNQDADPPKAAIPAVDP